MENLVRIYLDDLKRNKTHIQKYLAGSWLYNEMDIGFGKRGVAMSMRLKGIKQIEVVHPDGRTERIKRRDYEEEKS
jgi:hypothetical protein